MQDFIYKYKKQIAICGVLVVILVIAVSVYFMITDKINSVVVNIRVTPTIAKVKIGDRVFEPMGTYKIQPGEYLVEVSADGFETKTGSLVAAENESVDIQMFLEPTEENTHWYDEHPEDALILGEVKNYYAMKAVQELVADNPILSQLPIEIDYYTSNYAKRVKYTISYRLNAENDGFAITITDYTGGNYESALSRLKTYGVDADDYKIEYSDESADLKWGRAE